VTTILLSFLLLLCRLGISLADYVQTGLYQGVRPSQARRAFASTQESKKSICDFRAIN
jgi:hypothetical protein